MENEELVQQIQAGVDVNSNLEQLYLQNRSFIFQLASKYSGYVEIDDLMQEGYLGLYKAANEYITGKGTKFITYAAYWIEQYMRRYCENHSSSKRISAYMLARISKYKQFLSTCKSQNKEPTEAEVCTELNISIQQLKALKKTMQEANSVSLQTPIDGKDNISMEDTIPDPSNMEEDVTKRLTQEYFDTLLWNIVDELNENESKVISGYYRYSKTLEELGKELHLSGSRIAQIKNKALNILRCNREVEKIASFYGCAVSSNYKCGLRSFRAHGSSTENIALARIERDEKILSLEQEIQKKKAEIQQTLNIDELFSSVVNFASQ